MTVSSLVNRADYTGNGVAVIYSYPFRIFAATDLVVTTADLSGNESVLSYPGQYSVSGVGNSVGGSITLTTVLASGWHLTIERDVALLQTSSFRNQAEFFPAVYENAIDYVTMALQEIQADNSRFLAFPATVDTTVVSGILPPPVANDALFWDANGVRLENRPVDSSAIGIPGQGRTVSTATALIANDLGTIFNVLDYGAVGNGVADDTAAINLTWTRMIAHGGGRFRMPGGIYKTTSNLVLTASGSVPLGVTIDADADASIIRPAAGVTIGLTLDADSNTNGATNTITLVGGLVVDMVNCAAGSTGVLLGSNSVSADYSLNGLAVIRAGGIGSIGLDIRNAVGVNCAGCVFSLNATNVRVSGSTALPTTVRFYSCVMSYAGQVGPSLGIGAGVGVSILQGYSVLLRSCTVQANCGEGLRVVPTGSVAAIMVEDCWFEDNNRALAAAVKWHTGQIITGADSSLVVTGTLFNAASLAVQMVSTNNSIISDLTLPRIQYASTGIAATSTGYSRAAGSWIDAGFAVGQRINARGFVATLGNNKFCTVTNVTAMDLTTDGVSVIEASTAVTRSVTVVFVQIDSACSGSFHHWNFTTVPVESIENNSPIFFSGFDTYWGNGVAYADPASKALLFGTTGLVSIGSATQRAKDIFLAGTASVGTVIAPIDTLILRALTVGYLRGQTGQDWLEWGTGYVNINGLLKMRSDTDQIQLREAPNAQVVRVALAAGTVTVANPHVTATSNIFMSPQNSTGTAGILSITARSAGSFTITSSNAADGRTIACWITEAL